MHEFAGRGALGAVRAAIDRAVPTRLLTDPHAVRHFGDHGAADRAMRADIFRMVAPATLGPAASAFCTLASGSAPIVCQAAGDETGTAQEATTIETNARLTADRRSRDCCDVSGALFF